MNTFEIAETSVAVAIVAITVVLLFKLTHAPTLDAWHKEACDFRESYPDCRD